MDWKELLIRRIKSFGYAGKGLYTLFRTQPNAWIHLTAVAVVSGAGWWLGIERWEWIILVLCYTLVLMAEAFNTALEFLTDLASPEAHPLAGKTKDVAAAGVLIAALGAVVVAAFIFGPPLRKWWLGY
ncbi:MAG: diacylglycerol kinase family protein [Lewinella sp.]|nr:diacylglycerol kinase family protein [Lewinella sp.]